MTTDHDPLCYMYGPIEFPCPQCALISKVRADERERIALVLEASQMRFGYGDDAARIARGQPSADE